MDKVLNPCRFFFHLFFFFFTSNLHFASLHLAGRDGANAGITVGADLPGEAPTDRQVVDVLVVPDLVVLTLQGSQVKLVAGPGVANPAVVPCNPHR